MLFCQILSTAKITSMPYLGHTLHTDKDRSVYSEISLRQHSERDCVSHSSMKCQWTFLCSQRPISDNDIVMVEPNELGFPNLFQLRPVNTKTKISQSPPPSCQISIVRHSCLHRMTPEFFPFKFKSIYHEIFQEGAIRQVEEGQK